ncbi:DNA repair protein rad50 [Mycena venus]|uniref:DNA repair protein RAD50 n=1 Tax=Mycena venus TaxID=2733690 RepID=A0A8H6YUN9_9AGAR|nr:DNA repair protein rad50 [Mycena venus]
MRPVTWRDAFYCTHPLPSSSTASTRSHRRRMASLNKLAIRGIRSFDDKQISVIEFFSPVTVIVGHNGSGKTTIIECLKYATTGDQPPNTRGGAFIHDPKMANEKEVKAQVKLRFHSANGTRMLAVRNLSVTVKKTAGLTMKTLESILALADNNSDKGGKRGVISTKCAEMDTEIPQLLGVSKAVLENVIFCHQEDSYWPLAEPAALKKKFDDIFEATKYTKALDSIKSLRKDRVAELKTEKERLDGLSREKAHADKLKARIADLNQTIAAKEVEHDDTKKAYDELVVSNQKFYEYATHFREVYIRVENAQANMAKVQADLEEAKANLQEMPGTDDELEAKLNNADGDLQIPRQKLVIERNKAETIEEELQAARKQHTELAKQQGTLKAEYDAQQERIAEREVLIHKTSEKFKLKGFSSSGLDGEKVVEFISKLEALLRKQKGVVENLQREARSKSEEYTRKSTELNNALQANRAQKSSLQKQLSNNQTSISLAERELEATQSLPSELRTLTGDIEEKQSRLAKVQSEIAAAKYDERLDERTASTKALEEKRDVLNSEFKALNMHADSRAKLDLKRKDVKSKTTEITTTVSTADSSFRRLVGTEPNPDTMEREVDRIYVEKEQELGELEGEASSANATLQQAQSLVSSLKTQLKTKKDELKALEKKLKTEIEHESLDAALEEASKELDHRKGVASATAGSSSVYEHLLRVGKQKKVCTACNRHMDDHEVVVFEKYLKDQMKKSSPESVAAIQEELKEWEGEMTRLQNLRPVLASRDRLKDIEIPELEAKIKEQDAKIPAASAAAESVSEKVEDLKRDLRDIRNLKTHAQTVSRLQKELKRANEEVADAERQLSATGSTKTLDDVQNELDDLLAEIRKNDKQKEALIHTMEMEAVDLKTKIRAKQGLEERIEKMKKEITMFSMEIKVSFVFDLFIFRKTNLSQEEEAKIIAAQAPIDALEEDHLRVQRELSAELQSAQNLYQELSTSVDRLNQTNKGVETYVRNKREQKRQETADKSEEVEVEIKELELNLEAARQVIKTIEKEINQSGSYMATLRENIRVRKLMAEIKELQAAIDKEDIEGAAKAKRNFQEKYSPAKEKETKLQTAYAHMAGELSSSRSQLKSLEGDLKDFKDINKKYTDQLIKVKMSDMANSDLEKYAKALDNAIMKYHGLKMEEVNDTMKHLWNKTYQGTDIDGIKIRSDVEGGASKRSYNYRVVMTKDQVEMDMRGRCSAGQKMLASIIIRLALSDSFGQNCGILALDEPTNALDTENIDALAESLVDIIKERRNHSNFQLIIITHDENFLRKLGQSDVMEYYWRVSRDSRQKSVIERQRFR